MENTTKKKFTITKWHLIGALTVLLIWWLLQPTPYDPAQKAVGITGQVLIETSGDKEGDLLVQVVNQSGKTISYKMYECRLEVWRFGHWFRAPRLTFPVQIDTLVLYSPQQLLTGEARWHQPLDSGYLRLPGHYRVVIPGVWEDGTGTHIAIEFDRE